MLFFFFKQKTAYEMRISDWSSDVCSSDLFHPRGLVRQQRAQGGQLGAFRQPPHARQVGAVVAVDEDQAVMLGGRRQQARRAIDGDAGARRAGDRKSVVSGTSVSVRVARGGRRIIKTKKQI